MIEEYSADDLIRLLKAGNEKAFKAIFHRYYRPLTLFALKYVGDVEEAKEITQEFFIRIWSRRTALEITSLKAYLYRGVKNACLNHLESGKVLQRRMQDFDKPLYTTADALQKMLLAEQEEEIIRAIDRLPPRCREIFLLSRTEQLPNKAIADRLNISVRTVETQVSIALRRLRDLLISFLIQLFLY